MLEETVVTKWLRFEDISDMIIFIVTYREFFKSYSHDTIMSKSYTDGGRYYDKDGHWHITKRGYHNNTIVKLMEMGLQKQPWGDDHDIWVHIDLDIFKSIEHRFIKEKVARSRYRYVYKKEVN